MPNTPNMPKSAYLALAKSIGYPIEGEGRQNDEIAREGAPREGKMKTVNHPYLEGVKCREDGACFVPANGKNKAHWTFGCRRYDGYLCVAVAGKLYLVHRLVAESFHGLCPPGKCQVDHRDRNPSNNRPENLRWCTPAENLRNTWVHEASVAKYGVSGADDRKAYKKALRQAHRKELHIKKVRDLSKFKEV